MTSFISFLAGFFLLLLVCRAAYLNGYGVDLANSSAPAWIQAIGSVFAIVAAAWIAQRQTTNARKLEDYKQAKSEKQKLEVIMALMARSHGLALDICKAYESQEQSDIDQISPHLMEDTHNALMALPVFDIPEWQLSLDVLMVSRALASLKEQFLALGDSSSHEELSGKLKELNESAVEVKGVSFDSLSLCKDKIKERERFLLGKA
ncbi:MULTISPECIES: hypothetical protein [unclassified Pseudomonas]|uniref:hypothetical protein n=1 Tax=unclassified Pseudomonas TaxID=196821 RepID=UPI0035BEBF74